MMKEAYVLNVILGSRKLYPNEEDIKTLKRNLTIGKAKRELMD
jgi:hypothetical protein